MRLSYEGVEAPPGVVVEATSAGPDEWRQYETERAALKARLEQALATAEATRYV